MDSLEENFPYTLMGKSNLMLYPYITLCLKWTYVICDNPRKDNRFGQCHAKHG